MQTQDISAVQALYKEIIAAWNAHDAARFAACFTERGVTIGFDGSLLAGADEIRAQLAGIFRDHQTAPYIYIIREVLAVGAEAALLRADAGMPMPGTRELNPAVNAVQSLVAGRTPGGWRAVLLQNTPAQFHGRPEMADALTRELSAVLQKS
ncbi:MAG: SgcJ/EcaC family oxidoreductase [Anaerolineae bacterium]